MPDPGIGTGIGGMIASIANPGLASSVAQHMTPNPNPLAQQGQSGAGMVDSLGNPIQKPNLAQPAVTQPDPANAANVARLAAPPDSSAALDYMRYQRMGELANSFNRSIQGVAAGFGTAQQQASKQAALRGGDGTVGGGLGDLAGIQALQDQTIKDNEHARFMGNAAVFAQALSQALGRPVSVQEAQMYQQQPDLMRDIATTMTGNQGTTNDVKNFNASRAAATDDVKREHPDWTPDKVQAEVANRVPSGILAMGAGATAEDQAYYAYAAQARAAGQPVDDIVTWKGKHTAETDAAIQQKKDATKFRDDAFADYTPLNSKFTEMKPFIDTLMKDPESARKALGTFSPTTGKWGEKMPEWWLDPKVKAAAIALQKIQATLSGQSLTDVKNVRNSREFNTLAQAATGGLDASASPEDFAKSITNIRDKYLDAKATNELANGHKLTGELIGHGNSDLLEKTINGKDNPYYNGGSEDANPLVGRDLEEVRAALEAHPEKKDIILQRVREKGFSPRGFL